MVRAAVAFLRGAWPFLEVDFFWLAEVDEELFFFVLVEEEVLLGFFVGADEESWAGSPLPCSSNSAARLVAMNRLWVLTGFSVTRFLLAAGWRSRCTFRFPPPQSNPEARTYLLAPSSATLRPPPRSVRQTWWRYGSIYGTSIDPL
jgi:hypothetical protein